MEQISQMDDLVQYQLKRAMMGQQGLQRSKTELKPAVETFGRMLSKIYSDKSVKLHCAFPDKQLVPINKDNLMELLGNLLENAYRFCISEVAISVIEKSNLCVIRIEDDGPGVKPEMREAIFQRGVRAD